MLDPRNAASVRQVVGDVVRARGLTTVVVEHRLGPWLDLVDRVVVLGPEGDDRRRRAAAGRPGGAGRRARGDGDLGTRAAGPGAGGRLRGVRDGVRACDRPRGMRARAVGAAYLPAPQRAATGHDRRGRRRPRGLRRVDRGPGRAERVGQVDPAGGAGRSDPPVGRHRDAGPRPVERPGRARCGTAATRSVPAVITGPRPGRRLGTATGGQHDRATFGPRRGARHVARRRARPGRRVRPGRPPARPVGPGPPGNGRPAAAVRWGTASARRGRRCGPPAVGRPRRRADRRPGPAHLGRRRGDPRRGPGRRLGRGRGHP